MASTSADTIRLGSGLRTMLMRPGVGAAGHIVQRSDLTTNRVVVDQATLILVEEGRKRISWPGGERVAGPGEALSVQAGTVVNISNTPGRSGSYRALWICWSAELLALPGAAARRASPDVARHAALDEEFRASFHRAFDSLGNAEGLPAPIATHRLREVLLWLGERGFRFAPPAPASLAQQVRRLLAADPSADWSMERVARETATSVPTLRRRLVAQGAAFRDLVQDVRMSHAHALLQNTDVPVLHVALEAGYASPSRFSARFRKRFGYRPTDIRGQNRGRSDSSPPRHHRTGAV